MMNFNPRRRPVRATPVFDTRRRIFGTYSPYTGMIHPHSPLFNGPLEISKDNVYDMQGNLVGSFTVEGTLRRITDD